MDGWMKSERRVKIAAPHCDGETTHQVQAKNTTKDKMRGARQRGRVQWWRKGGRIIGS
jgi:hypothetical protein